jgi:hypothetical protein
MEDASAPQAVSFVFSERQQQQQQQTPNLVTTFSPTTEPEERYFQLFFVTPDLEEALAHEKSKELRLGSGPGQETKPFEFNELPKLFERLDDARYRLYLVEDGVRRLVLDFVIDEGRPLTTLELDETESDNGENSEDSPVRNPSESDLENDADQTRIERPGVIDQGRRTATSEATETVARKPFITAGGIVLTPESLREDPSEPRQAR